jgi:Kef-type K+ transport system membrane component KefB
MISRGEVGLIIASLGLSTGLLNASDPLFATVFMVILLSTVLTPPLVRRVFQIGESTSTADSPSQSPALSEAADH